MEAKVAILRALQSVLNLRQQFRMLKLLNVFKLWKDDKAVGKNERYMERLCNVFEPSNAQCNQLNLSMISQDISINAVLLDLLMYEDNVLFEAAFQVLQTELAPFQSIMSVCTDVFMLDTQSVPVFGTFDALDCAISQLRREFETASVWGISNSGESSAASAASPIPRDKSWQNVWEILSKIKCLLGQGGIYFQLLLYNLDLDNTLLAPLLWHGSDRDSNTFPYRLEPAFISEESLDDKARGSVPDSWKSLVALTAASLDVLFDIIQGNQRIRKNFRKYTDKLLGKVGFFPQQVFNILSEVYKGSVEVVLSTPEEVFAEFAALLVDELDSNYCAFSV
jgi:hypothetical protein